MKHTRAIAMLLALCMVVSMLPMMAFAAPNLRDLPMEKREASGKGKWTDQKISHVFEKIPRTGISTADVGDQYFEESEPNGDFETANVIAHDYTIAASLPSDDMDYYVFELTAESEVTIISACTTSGLLYRIYTYDTQKYVTECEYLDYDEEQDLYADGIYAVLPAGVYCMIFQEMENKPSEYIFFMEVLEQTHTHVYDDGIVTTEPTCTEDGILTFTCVDCGGSYTETIPAEGHDYADGIVTTEPTCTEDGILTFTCVECGDSYTEAILAEGHDYADGIVTTEPTCTEDGILTFTCVDCGDSYTEAIPAEGHDWNAGVVTKEPTETETGIRTFTCGRCGETDEEIIPVKEHVHSYTPAVTAPTCTEDGYTTYTCSCGATYTGDVIDATGHHYENGTCVDCGEKAPNDLAYCGENLTWTFDAATGTLTISGTGDYFYYTEENPAPWKELSAEIKKVVVEDGVEGVIEFGGCKNLETVILGDSVNYIGYGAFSNCVKLTDVVLPENLEYIYDSAFFGCTGLTSVTVPATVETIDCNAFAGCTGLKEVVLQEGLKNIESNAFENCTALETVSLPVGINFIRDMAFAGCTGLKEIYFLGDYSKNVSNEAFVGVVANAYYNLKNTTWRDVTLKNYGGELTWGTFILEEDRTGVCGDNLTWAYKAATDTLTVSGTGAMYDYYAYDEAPWNQQMLYIQRVIVEDGATTIGNRGFCAITELVDVTLPESVTSIGDAAFAACENLPTIKIPSKVTYIGHTAFHMDYKLNNVILPDTLTGLDMYAFCECTSLTSITIPASVTFVGGDALSYCSSLKEIRFQGNAPDIDSHAFMEVVADAYYPAGNATWTDEVKQDYGGTITWVAEGHQNENVIRIAGKGRSETAIAAADALKEKLGLTKFDTIIIASGEQFADALAGSYLAIKKDAPILLSCKYSVEMNEEYIKNNLAADGTIYILGGTADLAVPAYVEESLESLGFNITRLAGKDRYETNLMILKEAEVVNEEILVCTGWNFADSLAASATGLPILLVNSNAGKLTDAQIEFLRDPYGNDFTIIGGTSAVSQSIEDALWEFGEVTRLNGKNRYETSVLVAERFFNEDFDMQTPETVFLANGGNFPDGLCGGPLAHAYGAPLLLVYPREEAAAAGYVKANGIAGGAVMGGTAVVSEASVAAVFD